MGAVSVVRVDDDDGDSFKKAGAVPFKWEVIMSCAGEIKGMD